MDPHCLRGKGRKLGIFGSYGWGDGEWMRNWAERMSNAGAVLLDDGLMVHETPTGDGIEECRMFGERLARFNRHGSRLCVRVTVCIRRALTSQGSPKMVKTAVLQREAVPGICNLDLFLHAKWKKIFCS